MDITMRVVFLLIRALAIATISISFGSCNENLGWTSLCKESEKQSLLMFKQDLKDPANRLSSWVDEEDSDCCTWTGVICDDLTGHIRKLHLGNSLNFNSSLGGKVSHSLLNLKHLNYLDLSNNDFQEAQVPKFLGSLRSLRYLNLSKAGFAGIIPHQLGNLSSLRYLCLSDYKLKAENLQWISGLSHLEHLDMNSVDLSKASDWLQVTNMLPSLKELHMFDCRLDRIPPLPSINFTSLAILHLSANMFASSIPKWVFSLENLVSLSLGNCGFQGPIPNYPQNISSLREVDFSLNNLSLPIPKWLFNHKDLASLNLGYNSLEGPIPHGILNMTGLKVLNLESNLFNCTIPEWLYSFSNLESLFLSSNLLQGEISSSVGKLTSIVSLRFDNNQLEGKIPKSFEKLCKLMDLDLSMNNFTVGKVSEIIDSLSGVCASAKMKSLSLSYCNLSGHLTEKIGDFQNLSNLDLSGNSISGPVPASLGNLSFLLNLDISDNQFNGTLPEIIGQLEFLTNLDVSYNSLEGVVSEVHFSRLTRLLEFNAKGNSLILNTSKNWLPPFQLHQLYLDSWRLGPELPNWLRSQTQVWSLSLSNTGISGAIPTWFWNLSSQLLYLNISHNQLCGEVQDMVVGPSLVIDMGSNRFNGSLPLVPSTVYMLDLSNSSFSGSVSRFFCNSVDEPKQLYLLNLGRNLLTGKIPDCWMNWQNLAVLNLESNNLTGYIPSSMGYLFNLKSLQLLNNQLSGELPLSLQNCTELSVVDLGGNKFIGSLPMWIGKSLSNLMLLNFRLNKLHGDIPHELCNLINLQILDLADNNLSGTIPRCFHNFSAMATLSKSNSPNVLLYDIFSYGRYLVEAILVTKGRKVEYREILGLVTSMDLSNNIISGEIPEELASLLHLRTLNLSKNLLTGGIPSKIGNMRQIESLDLSMNQLDGEIPQSMRSLTFLSHLNLSDNNLKGKIPESTQLQSLDPSSFIGNELCGAPLDDCSATGVIPAAVEQDREYNLLEDKWFYVSLGLGFMFGFWSLLGLLLVDMPLSNVILRFLNSIVGKIYGVIVE